MSPGEILYSRNRSTPHSTPANVATRQVTIRVPGAGDSRFYRVGSNVAVSSKSIEAGGGTANLNLQQAHISCTLAYLANASYRLGMPPNFDPKTEQVTGDHEANRLLRDADRGYRGPFTIPERI